MQHSGIGGFGKWDGVLILYHGLITKTLYCAALLMTYLTVSNVYQELSKHYTYQAVHIHGELHKQFRQQLTPWLLLFLRSLEKLPANVHPLSLHHLLILGRPRTLVSKQPSYVSLPYGLCVVLPVQQRAHTHAHNIYHCSWQSKKASLTITVASKQKTDPFKYGAKVYIGAMDTAIRLFEAVPSYTGKIIKHPDLHPNILPLAKQFLSILPQA